jgi:hypothetical protein
MQDACCFQSTILCIMHRLELGSTEPDVALFPINNVIPVHCSWRICSGCWASSRVMGRSTWPNISAVEKREGVGEIEFDICYVWRIFVSIDKDWSWDWLMRCSELSTDGNLYESRMCCLGLHEVGREQIASQSGLSVTKSCSLNVPSWQVSTRSLWALASSDVLDLMYSANIPEIRKVTWRNN